jgi:hypothetical protein
MPKKTYKLLRFDGGINSANSPKDIGDNQLADLKGMLSDELGRLKLTAKFTDNEYSNVGNLSSINISELGKGLYMFTSDYKGITDGTANGIGSSIVLCVERNNSFSLIEYLYSTSTDAFSASDYLNLGSYGSLVSPIFIWAGGALRVYESDHSATFFEPRHVKYYPSRTIGVASTETDCTTAEDWRFRDAAIKNVHPRGTTNGVQYCKNAVALRVNDSNKDRGYSFNSIACDGAVSTYSTGEMAGSGTDEDYRWGVALEFASSQDGTGSGGWQPTTAISYQFWVTTVYDGGTQESPPELMQMKDEMTYFNGTDGTWNGKYLDTSCQFVDWPNRGSDTVGENLSVTFRPVIKFNNASTTTYTFGNGGTGTDEGNPRISGARIYFSSSEDGHGALWRMFDCDFEKGLKCIGAGDSSYLPWAVYDRGSPETSDYLTGTGMNTNSPANATQVGITHESPPRYLRYDVMNLHRNDEVIDVQSFKAWCIANNRLYIGNVKQDDVVYGDRMLKSGVNEWDKFPMDSNSIDAATSDGDDIIALVEYADRILQFKRMSLHIINVAKGEEFPESINNYKGIHTPGAVTKTDFGVAWANATGCFLFDGRQITNLLEKKGMKLVSSDTWSDFINQQEKVRIAYDPKSRHIIVLAGSTLSSTDKAYIFNLVLRNWSRHDNIFNGNPANFNGNFITHPKSGSLLALDTSAEKLYKWVPYNTSITKDTKMCLQTKELDFGEPAVRKKVYKIVVSWRGTNKSAPVNPDCYYRVNSGDGSTLDSSTSGWTSLGSLPSGENAADEWERAEFSLGSGGNNIYSIEFGMKNDTQKGVFEIGDISFIYRQKPIK